MLKYIILVTAAVILIAVIAHKMFLFSQVQKVDRESRSFQQMKELSEGSINYIVTSSNTGRISVREIDSLTSSRNFSFTSYNMKNSVRLKFMEQKL